jgi:hypothetical protein
MRRRQAERRLVEHEQARRAHQRARDGDRLLLAAAHRAGELLRALAQLGEVLQHSVEAARTLGLADEPAAELDVLAHRHARKKLPAFGHQRHAGGDDRVGALRQRPAVERDRAAAPEQAGDGLEQRRLARAVGPEDHREAGPHLEPQLAHDEDGAVARGQALDRELRLPRAAQRERRIAPPHHGCGSAISSPR